MTLKRLVRYFANAWQAYVTAGATSSQGGYYVLFVSRLMDKQEKITIIEQHLENHLGKVKNFFAKTGSLLEDKEEDDGLTPPKVIRPRGRMLKRTNETS